MSQHTSPVSSDRTKDTSHPASENHEQQDVTGATAMPTLNSDWSPNPLSERETVRRQMEAYNQARAEQEELQVEIATRKSLKDFEIGSANDECLSSPPLMEERINNMAIRLDNDLPLICDASGDTWVFVDPPAQLAQGDENYASYISRYESPFLLQAKFLMELGSAFFQRALSPSSQYRVLRRRGLAGKLPPGIKYVLDLTPPIEGDDAVYLTTELCCSQGVLSWSESNKRWGVSKTLVGGSEECSLGGPSPSRQSGESHPVRYVFGGIPRSADGEARFIPLEYSQIRHRAAIERVLLAIQGQDPQLNSAPKMWTTFAVAKYFDITHSPLTDYIVRWLRAYPNSYFVEVLPEVSLKIADGLQCQQLCRDTFAILVGEEALFNVHRLRGGAPDIGRSVHGRKRDDLPELYQTRVEYASKAFLDRITATFQELVGHEMIWMRDVPEYQKLASIDRPGVTNSYVLVSLKDRLKAYVRGAIYKLLCSNFERMPNAKDGMDGDDDLYPRTNWTDIWNRLLPRERIMTRSFWRALRKQDIICGSSNFDINDHMANATHFLNGEPTAIEESMLSERAAKKVYKAELEDLALRLEALSNAHRGPRPGHQFLVADLAIRYARDDAIKSGDDVDTVASVSTMAPTSTFKPTEGSMVPAFNALAKNYEDTSGLDSSASPLNATLATEDNYSTVCFEVGTFLDQARAYLRPVCDHILGSNHIYSPLELELTDTLVCLEDAEYKYLPIWANGNDDGSGGVYNDEVPSAYGGFSTAGPDVHTGTGSSSASSDGYELIGSQSDNSTRNTSTIVNDGRSSVLHHGRTYAMSEGGESWNTVPAGNHGEVTGLHAFSGNPPSNDTRSTILASDDGMLESLDEIDIDEEAKAKSHMARMEHMDKMASPAFKSPMDCDMEEAISNAFLEDDDDDSSATELGDPFSDTEAIDEVMEDQEDQEYDSESEDTIVV